MATKHFTPIIVLIGILFTSQLVQAMPLGSSLTETSPLTPQVATYYVDAVNGSNISGDGSVSAPWKTITYGLSQLSGLNVELRVEPGMYDTILGESFPLTMEPGVSLIGASFTSTVISGTTSAPVVTFSDAATYTETTQLKGFKITHGSEGVHIEGSYGGGSSPVIEANWITGNYHGLYGHADGGRQLSAQIRNNLIVSNTVYGFYGRADYTSSHVDSSLENNQVVNNGNAGIFCWAGSSFDNTSTCSLVLTANRIVDNGASGVVCNTYYDGQCNMQLVGNLIAGNLGWGYTHYHDGSMQYSYPKFSNNIVYENTEGGAGFGVDFPILLNDTFADNYAYGVVGGVPTIVNSIIWGQTDNLDITVDHVSYSNVGDGEYAGTNHNISMDPRFVDPANGDFHVIPISPVVNAGDNTASDLPAIDVDGDGRVLGAAVDIGADETQPYTVLLAQSVTPSDIVHLGENFTYTLIITNQSAWSAGGPLVTDTLPAETTWSGFIQASAGYANITSDTLRWTGTLSASSIQTIAYGAVVKSGLPVGTIITNTATIDNRTGGITTTLPVTVTVGPTVIWDTSAQTVDAAYAQPDQRITFTLAISNTGNWPAYDTIVTDTLDSHVTFATADYGGIFDTDRVIWNGLTVTNGTAITLTVAVTINAPLSDTTPIMNQVSLSGGQSSFNVPIITTTIYNPPQANFDVTPTLIAVPSPVTFTDLSQHATNYLWSYGDTTSSTVIGSHQHIYYVAGLYTVTLSISNPVSSDILTRTSYITAYNAANAYFSGSPTYGLWPLTVTYTNYSLNASQFVWDYGDGLTSTITATAHTHQYGAPGFYTVALTAVGPYNQVTYTRTNYIGVYESPSANFTASPRTGITPLLVNFTNYSLNTSWYRWDFGDGSISYSINPNHYYFESGTYTVSLIAYNPGGEDTLIRLAYISVYQPPSAGFIGAPLSGQTPLTVTFTNTSIDADSYVWDYGDGQFDATTAITHTHTYTQPGSFTIKLIAFNSHGQNTLTRTNYVAAYVPPLADFAATPLTGTSPLTVSFANLSQNATTYQWDFGDGLTSIAANPVHVYAGGGVYTVSLQASNPGGSAALTRTNYITVNQSPIAGFTAFPRSGLGPLTVTFTNTSYAADTYLWDYGDGITSTTTVLTHSHVYSDIGTYTVTLTALGSFGMNIRVRSNYVTINAVSTATVYYVDGENGSNEWGDGSVTAPWKTMTYALSQVAGNTIEIRVASGLYNQLLGESFPIIMKSGISLIGAGYPDTIISGNGSDYAVQFVGTTAYSTTTKLSGFKITGASHGVHVDGIGGDGTMPTIEANWITGNDEGIVNAANGGQRIYAVIRDNLITANTSTGIYNSANYGVAIASPQLTRNTIQGNAVAGVYCYATGSGYAYNGDYGVCAPYLIGNLIADNAGDGYQCHTAYTGGCSPTFTGNVIVHNGGWGIGRAHDWTYLLGSDSKFYNNIIANNGSGGAVFVNAIGTYGDRDSATFVNNTIVDNHTYGIIDGYPTLVNNIIWGQTSDLNVPISSVSYNDVGQGVYAGQNGNISVNPQFVNRAAGNYHLLLTSPVIDMGDSTVPDLPATDLDGNPRIMGAAVDMGAYETAIGLTGSIGITPDPVAAGQPITFDLQLTNTGTITLHAIITDALSPYVTPTNPLTWTAVITPGGRWIHLATATVAADYAGPITNTLSVTSLEGEGRVFTATAQALIPVSGLQAVNDAPTIFGHATTLTATVLSGNPVTYTWNLGDGTFATGASTSHIYPAAGHYTAIVTATNSVSSVTATTSITITITDAPITGLTAINSSPTILGQPTVLTATITGGSHVAYAWSLGDMTTGVGAIITHPYPFTGTYTAIVTATNSVSSVTATTSIFVITLPLRPRAYLPIIMRDEP